MRNTDDRMNRVTDTGSLEQDIFAPLRTVPAGVSLAELQTRTQTGGAYHPMVYATRRWHRTFGLAMASALIAGVLTVLLQSRISGTRSSRYVARENGEAVHALNAPTATQNGSIAASHTISSSNEGANGIASTLERAGDALLDHVVPRSSRAARHLHEGSLKETALNTVSAGSLDNSSDAPLSLFTPVTIPSFATIEPWEEEKSTRSPAPLRTTSENFVSSTSFHASPAPLPIDRLAEREAEERLRISAALQVGVIMGSLNTLGGGVSFAIEHDWQSATFRYTSTFGTKGNSDELFRGANTMYYEDRSQSVSEYAVMFGGVLREGNFSAKLEAGPNVIHATFETHYKSVGAQGPYDASSMIGGSLGASAQATFAYRLDDNLGVSLTGFASNHTITYGGVLLSLVGGRL